MEDYQKNRPNVFIDYLLKLSSTDDRAALADLRRGFSKATETLAWARIGAFCRLDSDERIVFQTIGAGYATNPNNDDAQYANFGDVARKLSDENGSFDINFRRILGCKTRRDVCQCLRSSILATKAKEVSVPWKNLLWDLLRWESDSEKIKERWAARYWLVFEENADIDVEGALGDEEKNE